jgi:hypothetical protein
MVDALPAPGHVSIDEVNLDDDAFAPQEVEIEFPVPRKRRPGLLKGPLGIPNRHTLTGVVYFYLVEHRDGDGVVNIEPLRVLLYKRRIGPANETNTLVHRKMVVLRKKHGMFIEKHGKEPYIYKVKTIPASRPRENLAIWTRLRETFLAFGGPPEQADDFMIKITADFRWEAI